MDDHRETEPGLLLSRARSNPPKGGFFRFLFLERSQDTQVRREWFTIFRSTKIPTRVEFFVHRKAKNKVLERSGRLSVMSRIFYVFSFPQDSFIIA